jgi:hypothetical protein
MNLGSEAAPRARAHRSRDEVPPGWRGVRHPARSGQRNNEGLNADGVGRRIRVGCALSLVV